MSDGERPKNWGKKILDKAEQLMEQAHNALIKNDPVIRDPNIDIEHNSVRVFFPRTGLKVQFRLMPDPALNPEEAERAWDSFLAQPERTASAMRKHKIFLGSKPSEQQGDYEGGASNVDPENDTVEKRNLSGGIIRREYGVTYDEYADAWYLARNTLLRSLKRS